MTATATQILESEVRELVRRRGLDPARDRGSFDELAREALGDYTTRAARGLVPDLPDDADRLLADAVAGFGPLQPYLDDPTVEEVWVNSPTATFVSRGNGSELTCTMIEPAHLRDLVERMLRHTGRRLDLSSPFVDAVLPDGSRLHVVAPDVTRTHLAVNIRKHVARASRLEDLVRLGSLTPGAAEFLGASVEAGLNILVSGATQAGKTTMLGALAGSIPSGQRVVTCEEVFELRIEARDVVSMQCRGPSIEGKGAIGLRRLVTEALRMRPDRLIVGEVRQAEALDLLIALNSGVPGMCTIHANSARDAVAKLCTLPLLAGPNVTGQFVVPTVATSVDLVIHLGVSPGGVRQVAQIASVSGRVEDGRVETSPLFERDVAGRLTRSGGLPPCPERFERTGIDVRALLLDSGDDGARARARVRTRASARDGAGFTSPRREGEA